MGLKKSTELKTKLNWSHDLILMHSWERYIFPRAIWVLSSWYKNLSFITAVNQDPPQYYNLQWKPRDEYLISFFCLWNCSYLCALISTVFAILAVTDEQRCSLWLYVIYHSNMTKWKVLLMANAVWSDVQSLVPEFWTKKGPITSELLCGLFILTHLTPFTPWQRGGVLKPLHPGSRFRIAPFSETKT